MFWLQSPVSWPPVLLLGLGVSVLGGGALFLHHLRRQVQAAWTETGRVYQRSTARFTAVGNLLEDALFETDATRTVTYANRSFHDLTGYRHRDIQSGLNLADMFDLASDDELARDLASLRRPDEVQVYRSLVCCRDGARLPVTLRLSAVREQNHVVGWRCLLEARPDDDLETPAAPVDSVLGEILKDVGVCPTERLHDALERGLAAIGRNLGADRCYHYALSSEGDGLRSFCQWYAPGVSPMSGDDILPGLDAYPWALQRLREDGVLMVPDVERLTEREVPERARWLRQGITSLLTVPLYHDTEIIGILGCETLGRVRRWTARDRKLMEAMALICQRVQNQRLTASRLSEANHRASHLAELLPEPVAVADRDGDVVAWNAALAELSGKPAAGVRGREAARVLEEFLPGAGAWLRAQLAAREPAASEFFPADDRWLQISLRPLDNHECLLHLCDVTRTQREAERIRDRNASLERAMADREKQLQDAQAQLLDSQKNMAVARMVTGLAHELNTPVGVGLTAASHLQDRAERLAHAYQDGLMRRSQFEDFLGQARESSALILDNLQRAADLVSGMRQAAVDQTAESKRAIPLRRYVGEVLLSLRPRLRERHVEVQFSCPEELVLVADPGALYRILSNLVMNAVQHAFDGMLVGNVTIAIAAEGDRITLTVADDGRGMTAERRARIFDPFYTTARDAGGMGLGLHIVYNLVTRNLGGSIACESAVGKGTTFRIEFPQQLEATPDERPDHLD